MEESEEDQVKMSKEKGTYYENTQDDPQVAIVETGKTQCSFVSAMACLLGRGFITNHMLFLNPFH